jgi:hypothetical protein
MLGGYAYREEFKKGQRVRANFDHLFPDRTIPARALGIIIQPAASGSDKVVVKFDVDNIERAVSASGLYGEPILPPPHPHPKPNENGGEDEDTSDPSVSGGT